MSEDVYARIQQSMKTLQDAAIGWEFEEEKTLAVRSDDGKFHPVHAEVHREPLLGFHKRPERLTVRFQAAVAALPTEFETLSLFEEGKPFGATGLWRRISGAMVGQGTLDLWYEECD